MCGSQALPGFADGVQSIVTADADDAISSDSSRLEHRRGIAPPGGCAHSTRALAAGGRALSASWFALGARPAPAGEAEQARDHEQAGAGLGDHREAEARVQSYSSAGLPTLRVDAARQSGRVVETPRRGCPRHEPPRMIASFHS